MNIGGRVGGLVDSAIGLLLGSSPTNTAVSDEWLLFNERMRRGDDGEGGGAVVISQHACTADCYSDTRKVVRAVLAALPVITLDGDRSPERCECLRARIMRLCTYDLGLGGLYYRVSIRVTPRTTTVRVIGEANEASDDVGDATIRTMF